MMKTYITLILLALFSFNLEARDSDATKEQIAAEIKNVKSRLNLSEDQIDKVLPVLESSAKQRRDVMEKYGIILDGQSGGNRQKMGFKKARSLKKDMEKVNKSTTSQLEKILTKEQMKEYEKIQEERKAKRKAKMKSKRKRR